MCFKNIIIAAIISFTSIAANAAINFPALTGRVVDNAEIIDESSEIQLRSILAAHEQQTSNQVVVVTLKSLQGSEIEDFGRQLGGKWGIGTKEKNNGVLFIIAPNERKTRIEVGYGLEGILTYVISKSIIENDIIPYFKKGDYSGGILNGTQSIIKALGGSYKASVVETSGDADFIGLLIVFGIIGMLLLIEIFGRNKRYLNGYYYYGFGVKDRDEDVGFRGRGGGFGGGGASGGW